MIYLRKLEQSNYYDNIIKKADQALLSSNHLKILLHICIHFNTESIYFDHLYIYLFVFYSHANMLFLSRWHWRFDYFLIIFYSQAMAAHQPGRGEGRESTIEDATIEVIFF